MSHARKMNPISASGEIEQFKTNVTGLSRNVSRRVKKKKTMRYIGGKDQDIHKFHFVYFILFIL